MKPVNLYRICTEDVGADRTKEIIGKHFDGFTLLYGEGVWKGISERALVVEIMGDGSADESLRIGALCEAIKAENHQEAVLLEVVEASNYIV